MWIIDAFRLFWWLGNCKIVIYLTSSEAQKLGEVTHLGTILTRIIKRMSDSGLAKSANFKLKIFCFRVDQASICFLMISGIT